MEIDEDRAVRLMGRALEEAANDMNFLRRAATMLPNGNWINSLAQALGRSDRPLT